MIGWFGEDAYDFVSDKVEDVWDATGAHVVGAAGDAVRALPGGDELLEAAQDFARTPAGLIVMRAISSGLFGGIAWAVGPQLASVTFAVPGLMRGDRFDEAWLTEFKWRVEKTAETLGPGIVDAFGAQLKDTLMRFLDDVGAGELVKLGVQELAKRYNVREDVAAFAIAIWNRLPTPARNEFDPVTGRQIGASWSNVAAPLDPCAAYAVERRRGETSARAIALRNECARSSSQQDLEQREERLLYGDREYEALYGARERAVLAPGDDSGKAHDLAIGLGAVAVAAGLLAWRLRLV